MRGERFKEAAVLDVRTHFKPTETFQCTQFSSSHPPGVQRGYITRGGFETIENKLFQDII